MGAALITSSSERWPERSGDRSKREVVVLATPVWSLRAERGRLSVVLQRATLPGGAELVGLVIELPHVALPYDFREGLERFRHHRGIADELVIRIDARVVLDWLNQASNGQISGSAQDDQLVLSGRTGDDTRWTMRGRFIAATASDGEQPDEGEPLLQLSLFGMRAYGPTDQPWPRLAEGVLDLIPKALVVERGLTTAKIRCVRTALAWVLAGLGWKLPDLGELVAHGVELREGRFVARFSRAGADAVPLVAEAGEDGAWEAGRVRGAFERFVEDLELKRHHGQVDRLLAKGRVREALAEVYRALDGPPRPGFLAERLIGITATQPIMYDEGERHCRALLEMAPGWEPALAGLAAIALGRGRPEEAAVQLERLLAGLSGPADREDATAADLTLARILRDFAPEEARAALSRVLERAPDHEEALSELIALAEAEGDGRAALPLYKRLLFAARSKVRTRDAGLMLARFALMRNDPEDARVLLKVVLEAAPDDLEAKLALAEVETQEGHGPVALRILEDALRTILPSDGANAVKVIQRMAHLLLDTLADPARARRVLWRAGDISRMEAKDALGLGRLALAAREPILALRFVELVPDEAAEWAGAQAVRAEALIERGDLPAALKAVLAVLAREPDHEGALGLLERSAPDPARREWLVHQLHETGKKVARGEPRARILHRVARLYESLGLQWDALEPLEEAVFEALDSARMLERSERLMDLQARFGLWPDHQRVGALRLKRLESEGIDDEAGIERRVGLLVRLGRAALEELEDPLGARVFLEEAGKLSPRSLAAQELLARALEAGLVAAGGRAGPVRELAGALIRLESLRPDAAGRDEARLALAQLQLEKLNAPGQARATLSRIDRAGPRALALMRRAGMQVPDAVPPTAPATAPAPVSQPPPPARPDRFAEALKAADRGDEVAAAALLEELLTDDPEHVPARELLGVLLEDVFGPATEPSPRPAYAEPPAPAPVLGPAPVPRAARAAKGEASEASEGVPIEVSEAVVAKAAEGDRIDASLALATERYFAGDLPGARDLLETLLVLDPDVLSALELYQEILGQLGEHEKRAEVLDKLVMRVFDVEASTGYLRLLGDSHAAAGDDAAARAAWVRYLRLRPLDLALFSRVMGELEAIGDAAAAAARADLWDARADALDDAGASDEDVAEALRSAAQAHAAADHRDAAAHAEERARSRLRDL